MPEGHTLHRLARDLGAAFGGQQVTSTSPQGRFALGAALVDGRVLHGAEAYGKHLFVSFDGVAQVVHVHLGLYGSFIFGDGEAPAPAGALRWRLATRAKYADLRGATACDVLDPPEADRLRNRLGPDPLRTDAEPERAWSRIRGSRAPLATLLMDQSVLAGVGNVYRAEVLFRHRVDPFMQGRFLKRAQWYAMWADLVALMAEGFVTGRIDTVQPEHEPEAMGRPPREDAHGGEVYVYRRNAQPCFVCGTLVRTREHADRNLFWCPRCQRRSRRQTPQNG